MDSRIIKSKYIVLCRKYGMDWRLIKSITMVMKEETRKKGSKLDYYINDIIEKLSFRRITVRGVYAFMDVTNDIDRMRLILTILNM